jgi:hypothetical protein
MDQAAKISKVILGLLLVITVGVPAYALPATISLGWGMRPGLLPLTISQAAQDLRQTGKKGWQLVEAARVLVAKRMQYSRRNSFDPASWAFKRGYGYCIQQAYALVNLLTHLGFNAKVVHAFRNRLPDGSTDGHAWVNVEYENDSRYIDTLHYDVQIGAITHTPLSTVREVSPIAGLFFSWGCTAANAHRYYVSGKDM